MISFAKIDLGWLNKAVKNTSSNIKNKLVSKYTKKYLEKDVQLNTTKNTDINVLLNRVRLNKKNESRKKIYFSAASAAGLFLFGLIIF